MDSVNLGLTCFYIIIFRPLCVLVAGGSAARWVVERSKMGPTPQAPCAHLCHNVCLLCFLPFSLLRGDLCYRVFVLREEIARPSSDETNATQPAHARCRHHWHAHRISWNASNARWLWGCSRPTCGPHRTHGPQGWQATQDACTSLSHIIFTPFLWLHMHSFFHNFRF